MRLSTGISPATLFIVLLNFPFQLPYFGEQVPHFTFKRVVVGAVINVESLEVKRALVTMLPDATCVAAWPSRATTRARMRVHLIVYNRLVTRWV